MKIRVLRSALEDLANGRHIYDKQAAGIGDYFFESVFSEIDSLALFGGFIGFNLVSTGCWREGFGLLSTIESWARF